MCIALIFRAVVMLWCSQCGEVVLKVLQLNYVKRFATVFGMRSFVHSRLSVDLMFERGKLVMCVHCAHLQFIALHFKKFQ